MIYWDPDALIATVGYVVRAIPPVLLSVAGGIALYRLWRLPTA